MEDSTSMRELLDAVEAQSETLRVAALRGRLREDSGIPESSWSLSLESDICQRIIRDPMNEAAIAALKYWVVQGHSLLLLGGGGTGKTYLAHAAALDCLRQETPSPVAYVTEQHLLRLIRLPFGQGGVREAGLERFERIEVLVLDDLGRHSLTPYLAEALFDLLNARCLSAGGSSKTLITSHLSLERLAMWLDEADPPGSRSATGRINAAGEGSQNERFVPGPAGSRLVGLVGARPALLLGTDRRLNGWKRHKSVTGNGQG